MEKIKINEKLYDLVVNGLQLGEQGGNTFSFSGSGFLTLLVVLCRNAPPEKNGGGLPG